MAEITRRIGLSLASDICWPVCYEEIMRQLDLALPAGRDRIRFEVDRVTIEPFNLKQEVRYDVVIDRLTHWYHTSREWIKKSIILNDLYVFNNPWSIQSHEKHTSYCAMMKLGLHVPETWMIPPKEYDPNPDLEPTLSQYARLFDMKGTGEKIGYPFFMKPYDGGGWAGVSRIKDEKTFQEAYDDSGKRVMHLQRSVEPHDDFVRCVGLGPQVRYVRYDPAAPLHDRYTMDQDFLSPDDRALLRDITLTINSFFGWDFNSCESLRKDGDWHPIDFANPCPDSQVTSLHYHFPWLIKANIRWSVFCAATQRKMSPNLDWKPYFNVIKKDLPYRERVAAYGKIANQRFSTDRFEEFCEKSFPNLDEVVLEFFQSDKAKEAVRSKVTALYPEEEVEEFTELFWERIGKWRDEQSIRESK